MMNAADHATRQRHQTQQQLYSLQVLLERDATTSTTNNSLLCIDDWRACACTSRAWRRVLCALVFASETALFTSETCAKHAVPRRSERPERLRIVLDRCRQRFPDIAVVRALPLATPAQLARFHTERHVDTLTQLSNKITSSMDALDQLRLDGHALLSPRSLAATTSTSSTKKQPLAISKQQHYAQFEYMDIDADTVLMRHTLAAARTAAGGVIAAVDHVLSGRAVNAFCVVRPPGHHAEPHRAMGFCFFNNVGVGAMHALAHCGLSRVAIIDIDVHHGNGTQQRVEAEPRLLYVSLHQAPLFPGTGFAHECGPHNNIVNVPLRARTTSAMYRQLFLERVVPRVRAFAPQLVLVSAGFDAHEHDPLADIRLTAADYYWLTREIGKLAWASSGLAQGRVVSVLEGGYHLRALGESAEQHLLGLVHSAIAPVDGGVTATAAVDEQQLCDVSVKSESLAAALAAELEPVIDVQPVAVVVAAGCK